ncbi:MAG TPA: carboxypeptidase-like regulatory domain-containing protein [Candidatus Acidoferrum sp.]|jgi:hypothetical protein|nr:carboxypeptidase-like regulatory domain-containing protein [Candidatus Acidoferrum sp.]
MQPCRPFAVLCAVALLAPLEMALLRAQEPSPTPAGSVAAAQPPAASPANPDTKKYSHADDFLIRGTVFSEKALSFPGVQLRIRRAGEKKFRWATLTNSRGEFAVRVPQGSNYEMVVQARGFAEQTRTIDARTGVNEQSIVFRMQPAAGDKK